MRTIKGNTCTRIWNKVHCKLQIPPPQKKKKKWLQHATLKKSLVISHWDKMQKKKIIAQRIKNSKFQASLLKECTCIQTRRNAAVIPSSPCPSNILLVKKGDSSPALTPAFCCKSQLQCQSRAIKWKFYYFIICPFSRFFFFYFQVTAKKPCCTVPLTVTSVLQAIYPNHTNTQAL